MSKHYTGLLKKTSTGLVYSKKADETKYNHFIESLPADSLVEVYMEHQRDDGTLAQLAMVHAMIRELAVFIGETFEDMKLLVKRRAGLCIVREISGEQFIECKSLGKCNKEELSLVIEAIKEIGRMMNFYF